LNPRPADYESAALPLSYVGPKYQMLCARPDLATRCSGR